MRNALDLFVQEECRPSDRDRAAIRLAIEAWNAIESAKPAPATPRKPRRKR
jgi:hypothetical protein